ncbi:MAG: pilus assembly protein CpaB [Candidatus Eremiobacteraeota bacterium]|jgi:pilus assembly protein CpaB|nr:pilus assembly protein CpaB [Candidatus Eremiobacteraeota bacterium]
MSRVLARPLDTRTIALSVAGVLALGTGVLTFNYLSSVGHANAPVAQRTVLLASKAIPAHSIVTADMLATAQRPSSAVDPDAYVVPASAVGGIAVNDIPAGSQLTASKLMRAASSTFPSRVGHGMRAVAIPVDRVKSVSNLVKPGDRVDVIAVTSPRTDAAPKAMTIIRGAKVLSIGQTIDATTTATPAPESSQYGSATATLEVTPAQADMLALADINATLRLALRPPNEALRSQATEKLVFPAGQARVPSGPAPMQPQAAPRPAAPAQPVVKPAPVSPVAVIDGDKILNPGKAH